MNSVQAAAIQQGDEVVYRGHRFSVSSIRTGDIGGPHFRLQALEDAVANEDLVAHTLVSVPNSRGRKPLPPEQRKVQRTVILTQATLAALEAMAGPNEALGQVIDRLMAARPSDG